MVVQAQCRAIFPLWPVKSIRGIIRKTPGHHLGSRLGVSTACKIQPRP